MPAAVRSHPAFGRLEADELRIAIITRDRAFPARELLGRVEAEGRRVARRLRALGDEDAAAPGPARRRAATCRSARSRSGSSSSHIEGHVTQLRETLAAAALTRVFMLLGDPARDRARPAPARPARRPWPRCASAGRGWRSPGSSSRSCCSRRPATRWPASAGPRSTSARRRGVRRRRSATSDSRACPSSRSGRSRISPRSSRTAASMPADPAALATAGPRRPRHAHEQRRPRGPRAPSR